MYSFIETRLFTRLVTEYLSDDEYRRLQSVLIEDPSAGDVVPGSGGVRPAQGVIWMLTMYPKSAADNIPAHVLRQIRKEVDDA
jgi:hypothetical protein